MIMAIIMLINTAAEPKSFANPDKGCISSPTRSTTASIAVLSTSVKIINTIASTSTTCSVVLILKRKLTGTDKQSSSNSCLNADSFLYSHLNARKEFSEAR